MKLDYCQTHRGAPVEDAALPCLAIRHDDGRRATQRELWAEIERLRAENSALAREAHTWWTAARDAAKAERARCALRVALHSQYPIETDYDRGYDKARKDAAETLRTMGDDTDGATDRAGNGRARL